MSISPEVTGTHTYSRRLGIARATWVVLAVLTLGLYAVGLVAHYHELATVCTGAMCPLVQLTLEEAEVLRQWNLSVQAYALFFVVLEATFALAYALVGLVIFWRKPDNPLPLFLSTTLVVFGAIIPPPLRTLEAIQPAWRFAINIIQVFGWGSFFTFFYLFPNGQFVPRWTRTRPVLFGVWALAWLFFPGANVFNWPLPLALLVLLALFVSGMVAQIYRYLRVSNPAQRQQTKWVTFGFTAATVGIVLFVWPALLMPALRQPGSLRLLYHMIGIPFFAFALVLIPAAIGISILRYRLWDIDILINRTLVYGLLTAALALIYFAGVILLQRLFRILTGERNQLAIVASTLAIAALFNPLRHRMQDAIDRHFYRHKYDAARTLEVFAATTREETDLDRLADRLVQVVQETMEPAHASLWLLGTAVEGQKPEDERNLYLIIPAPGYTTTGRTRDQ